jgi:chaperonin GroES
MLETKYSEDTMNIRPLGDRVLVERIEQKEQTASGLIIPATAQEKPHEGKIVATGSGTRDENGKIHALEVKKGDRILFAKWGGTEVKLDGKDYLIMKESDILAIVDAA